MRRKIRVIISTFGPLHLLKSAESLSSFTDVQVIQGWIPKWWNRWFLFIASSIFKRDLRRSFNKRTPLGIKKNISLGIPEILRWCINLMKIDMLRLPGYINSFYGFMSRRYIKDSDILHVRSGSGGGGAIEKARKEGMKIIVDHSIAHPVFLDRNLREEYNKNGMVFNLGIDSKVWQNVIEDCKKADILLVNSQFVKDTFISEGFPTEKIRIAYLGVRNDFFQIKKDYRIGDSLKILFTGGFTVRKGAFYILEATKELDKMNISYELTIVGDSSEYQNMLLTYNTSHIKIVKTVPQDELKIYLSTSDVYLFPSLAEGCASSGMEAMAAGLPVIATMESGLPITNNENGILIPSKNIISIVNALMKILSDEKFRIKIGSNAAMLIKNNYTWDMYANHVFQLYKDLVK